MSEPIVIKLEYIPPSEVRGNSNAHWRKKSKTSRELRESAKFHVMFDAQCWPTSNILKLMPYDGKVRITYQFYHWRKIDIPNLAIGMKGFEDGLCVPKCQGCSKNCANEIGAGLLVDDDPDHVVYGSHEFHKCKKGESKTIGISEEVI